MSRSLNLSLTDELRAFVDRHSGDGSTYATPSEFVRALIREKKDREDATAFRRLVVEGYDDVRQGRTLPFNGDLRSMINESGRRDQQGWN